MIDFKDLMLPKAPDSVLDPSGQPNEGTYRGVPRDLSLARLSTVSRLTRTTGQKRWIYVGLFSEELVVGGCVVDLSYLASGFAFAFRSKDGELLDHHHMGPRLRQVVPDDPTAGKARFALPRARVEVHNAVQTDGQRRLEVRMGGGRQRLRMSLTVEDDGRAVEPLCAITRLPGGRASFTHKVVGLPVHGEVTMGGRRLEIENALAAVDYTHCLPEHRTVWYWACAAGETTDGRRLGLNLVQGWNLERPAENAAWVDGKLAALGPVTFHAGADSWLMEGDGLRVRFHPLGERRQDVDLKLIASRYVQPFGRFEGELTVGGETLRFERLWGVTEDHEAAW